MIGVSRVLLVLIAVWALSACAKSEYRPESRAPQYPPYQGQVALLDKFPASGTFERLGVITVESFGISYANTLPDKMTKEAAARGANAVVLQGKARSRRDSSGHEINILAGWAIRLEN